MTTSTYVNLLEGLLKNKYTGGLHLYLMAEPLCDESILNRIKLARDMFPNNDIFISTNGDFLKGPGHVRELLDAGLTWMAISDYDTVGKFQYTAPFPQVVVSTLDILQSTFYNRGGNVPVECIFPTEVCGWVSGKGYVNYAGDVILCCSDYDYSVVFGNTNDTTFGEIYNRDKYKEYRKAHALGEGWRMPLCENCNRIKHPC